jgi:hypothetical protein
MTVDSLSRETTELSCTKINGGLSSGLIEESLVSAQWSIN